MIEAMKAWADAQEVPFLYLTPISNYTEISPYRHDFCEQSTRVHRGELPLEDALQGFSLSTIFSNDRYFRTVPETGGLDDDFPGLTAALMDEFCRRAGCTWVRVKS